MSRVEPDCLVKVGLGGVEQLETGQYIAPAGKAVGIGCVDRYRLAVRLKRQFVLAEPVIRLTEPLIGRGVAADHLRSVGGHNR
jgi:hypothetical protein